MAVQAAELGPRPTAHSLSRDASVALFRRALADARVRTLGFAYVFAAVTFVQPFAYRHTYSTLAERLTFAKSFGGNKAVRLFYGEPFDLLTVGGYSAWRVGGTLAIFAAVFGLLAAVRALRAEEDAGRTELVLAGVLGRDGVFFAPIAAIAAGLGLLWVAQVAASAVAGLSVGGSAFLALAVTSVACVFVGVGAVASQLAPTRRLALELGGAAVVVGFLLRVIADTSSSVTWLRWATPLGWAEEMRPFTGAHPAVLVLPLISTIALLVVAHRLAVGRDLGSGLLRAEDTAEPRLRLLSSTTALALRGERVGLAVWLGATGAYALVMGIISKSVSSIGISKSLDKEFAKLGAGSVLTPKGYIGFAFIFFVLVASLFACAQIGAARHEEAEQQLETTLALPVSRREWLGGRLALAAAGIAALSLVAGALTWAGAGSQGVHLSVGQMLLAGLNCLPVALLFLGLAALAYAIAPRASNAIAYGLVVAAFLWQLFGSLLGAPKWLVDITPFQHVGLVPSQSFRPVSALVMAATGVVAAAVAVAIFERRDLMGA